MSTPTFKRLSVDQFAQLLAQFPFARQINAVHMHHTWNPARADFKGHETIVAMWRFHTQVKRWRDIAQHVTIDPNGDVWLGRNWNLPPASAAGYNGNAQFGPFMFETIGNFDIGRDPFDGAQRESVLKVIALVQSRFRLAPTSLMFHNTMSAKSCPGSSLAYDEIVAAVQDRRAALESSQAAGRDLPRVPFPDEPNLLIAEAIQSLSRSPASGTEPADAELSHDEQFGVDAPTSAPQLQASRDPARDLCLDAAALAAMRPHLVNLTQGRFSSAGEVGTTPADVDAIFEQHLPRALADAKSAGRKLRVVFYAHGGLVSESSGLQIAAKHIEWWKRNDVYPIYFIWETGFFETIGQLLNRAQRGTARSLGRDLADFTSDPLIEIAGRALQGPRIWGGMKNSAEHAVDAPTASNPTGGGARYVAAKLSEFCDGKAGDIELHAVGHSAGSIFHSYFLPTARELKAPTFTSAHFLAPAVRVDTFNERLADNIGPGKAVQDLTVFTMKKDFERDDNCAQIYRKSLLYLIYYALEDKRSTPILGLEESLRSDSGLKKLLGLDGSDSTLGRVVWSVSDSDSGCSASTSRSHGGFDDDPPTLNSVVRRVLGKEDADPIVEFSLPRGLGSDRAWIDEVDWPEELESRQQATFNAPASQPFVAAASFGPPAAVVGPTGSLFGGSTPPSGLNGSSPSAPSNGSSPAASAGGGRRRALCVGINRYPNPAHQLAGCVADARMWADTLTRLGFTASLLVDEQATRAAIDRELNALIGSSRTGDVIVFQYAGHGTHVPDLNGDEEDGQDEALCPVDFAAGALYIDDDIAQAFARLPDGVNLTCFTDCCHSGSNSRFAVGVPTADAARAGKDERKRYVIATPDIVDAHVRFRQQLPSNPRAIGTGGQSLMRDVKFAACLDSEVAWESEGHGEFTLRATRILAAGINGLTNDQFLQRVTADFGVRTRQHPLLDCAPGVDSRPLLQPLAAASGGAATPPGATRVVEPFGRGLDECALVLRTLDFLQQVLTQPQKQ